MTYAGDDQRDGAELKDGQASPPKIEVVWVPPAQQSAPKPALRFDHGLGEPDHPYEPEDLMDEPLVVMTSDKRSSRAPDATAPKFESLVPKSRMSDPRLSRSRAPVLDLGDTLSTAPTQEPGAMPVGVCSRCGSPVDAGPFCSTCGFEWARPTTLLTEAKGKKSLGTSLGLIGVAAVVFIVCSLVQGAFGSSMFSSQYSDPGLVGGLLINVTYWPGWAATIFLAGIGLLGLWANLSKR